jgi:hypothetical protein
VASLAECGESDLFFADGAWLDRPNDLRCHNTNLKTDRVWRYNIDIRPGISSSNVAFTVSLLLMQKCRPHSSQGTGRYLGI